MPGAGRGDNHFSDWSKNEQTVQTPGIDSFGKAMRTLSTELSPRIGGNLSGQVNPMRLWTSAHDGATLSIMPPAAVCPKFLHRVIHRLPNTVRPAQLFEKTRLEPV
jgi:hypothetical protein